MSAAADTPLCLGLDLGQAVDFSALAIAELVVVATGEVERIDPLAGLGGVALAERIRGMLVRGRDPDRPLLVTKQERQVHVRYLARVRGMPYPQVVEWVAAQVDRLPPGLPPVLVVDATGVGRAVVDLFRRAGLPCTIWAVTITGGGRIGYDGTGWTIPKRELIGDLAVALQTGRLKIARGLRDAKVLTRELGAYRMRTTAAGGVVYDVWREGEHDDLLFATALATWAAGRLDRASQGGLM